MPANVLLAAQRPLSRRDRVAEDLLDGLRRLAGRVDEPARLTVLDLDDDPAHPTRHRRPRLPEPLGHRQPEALADRLLEHRRRGDLEGVDLDRADVVEVREDVDVRIALRVRDGLVVERPAPGIVARPRPTDRPLRLGTGT